MAKHKMEIGPTPAELWLELNFKDPTEDIEWHSDDINETPKTFMIRFPIANASVNGIPATPNQQPFVNMAVDKTGKYWDFLPGQCTGNECWSGPINPNLPRGTDAQPVIKKYKYDQHKGGHSHDGMIIIKP